MVNPLATLRQTKLRIDKVENAAVPPNTERTLCNRTDPGVVASLWMALGGGAAPALDGRLRVYYDGSPTAAIDIDMGTLLATHWPPSFTAIEVSGRHAGAQRTQIPREVHLTRHDAICEDRRRAEAGAPLPCNVVHGLPGWK